MRLLRRVCAMLKSSGLLKAELAVTASCFLLPDLLDKPLWLLGIGMGRFVGHTLLFVFLVAFVFFLRKRTYGLFALMGGMLHLLSDVGSVVPWLYPFKKYDFPQWEYRDTFTWGNVIGLFMELASVMVALALVILAVSLLRWLLSRRRKLGRPSTSDDEAVERDDKH